MAGASTVMFTKNLGAFQIQATVEETHTNNLGITNYPVEKGAEISDHAQIKPKQFDIVCGVSNVVGKSFSPGRTRSAYETLKQVQESREPFTIQTNLTTLSNMLIESWTVHQDKDSAHVMIARAHCKEVILVGTQNVATVLRPPSQDDGNGGEEPAIGDTMAERLQAEQTQNKASPTVNRGDVATDVPVALTSDQIHAIIDAVDGIGGG